MCASAAAAAAAAAGRLEEKARGASAADERVMEFVELPQYFIRTRVRE
jgi:hypothetical protein